MEGNISSVSELRHRVFAQDRLGGGPDGTKPNNSFSYQELFWEHATNKLEVILFLSNARVCSGA
jgi:hypothetical protein